MVFKKVIGCWLSLVNSILCLPLREPGRLLERMILGSHIRCEHVSTKNWRDSSVQLHSSFSFMHKPLTMQLVSSFKASSIGVGTCFLMTALNSSSHAAFLFPVLLPFHKLFQKLLASLMSLNISSPFKPFFLVYLRPSFSSSHLSLSLSLMPAYHRIASTLNCWLIVLAYSCFSTLTKPFLNFVSNDFCPPYIFNKKMPEGFYTGCVGLSKNYVEWHWKVEQCINNKCVRERRRCSVTYTRRWVTHKCSFAP